MKILKLGILISSCLLFCGCLDFAPKADRLADIEAKLEAKLESNIDAKLLEFNLNNDIEADVEARIETKLENRLEASINNKIEAEIRTSLNNEIYGNTVDTKISALETKLITRIQQTFGEITGGQVNAGMFSGGALYITIICALIIVCIMIFAVYYFYSSRQWKNAYHAARDVIMQDSQSRSLFNAKMDDKGLSKLK